MADAFFSVDLQRDDLREDRFDDDFFADDRFDEDFLAEDRFDVDFFPDDLFAEDFLADAFLPEDFLGFGGTFAPFFRASDRPMAIACSRLFTCPPLPPLLRLSVPRLRRRMALSTFLLAERPYRRLLLDFLFVATLPPPQDRVRANDR